jgi:hypothetical protein
MASPLSKKQRLDAPASELSSLRHANGDRVTCQQGSDEVREEELALTALVKHRAEEVETIKKKVAFYTSKVNLYSSTFNLGWRCQSSFLTYFPKISSRVDFFYHVYLINKLERCYLFLF